MNIPVRPPRSWLLLLGCLCLGGCLPAGPGAVDEQKESHFLEGKSLVNALDFHGAIEAFEKALEANPKSASAHFELGWLFDQKETDPAAAIYHYEKYLKLRANAENAETVTNRIGACKQELAQALPPDAMNQTLQRQCEQLDQENRRLKEQLAFYKTNNPPALNRAAVAAPQARLAKESVAAGSVAAAPPPAPSTAAAAAGARTHTVKSGETPSLIARQHGVKVAALLAANPRVEPRRLRVGQNLNIPTP